MQSSWEMALQMTLRDLNRARSSLEGLAEVGAPGPASDGIFSAKDDTTAALDNCSVCVIKPHAVKRRQCGCHNQRALRCWL